MAVKVGDKIPNVSFKHLTDSGMQEGSTETLFAGKRSVLFAVPGAFTPTCSAKHLPGFVQKSADLKAKGVDQVVCMAVNDPFVMKAWADQQSVGETVTMLPDGNGTLTDALGLQMDGTGFGLGKRSQRFAIIIEDGVVKDVAVEEPGAFEVSSADSVLTRL